MMKSLKEQWGGTVGRNGRRLGRAPPKHQFALGDDDITMVWCKTRGKLVDVPEGEIMDDLFK